MARERQFSFREGTSDKFWTISLDGRTTIVRWGRTGTAGQQQTKTWDSEVDAESFFNRTASEKLKKGYIEISAPAEPAPGAADASSKSAAKPKTPKAGKSKKVKVPAEPPAMPPMKAMVSALEAMDIDQRAITSFKQAIADGSANNWPEKFEAAFSDKTILTDWKVDPIEPLFSMSGMVAGHGVTVEIERVRGKITLDVEGRDYFVWSGPKTADLNDLAAAFAAVLGGKIRIFRLRSLEGADQWGHVLLSADQAVKVQEAMGVAFDFVFAEDEPRGEFSKAPRPKPKKINWEKEYRWIADFPPRYDLQEAQKRFHHRHSEALKHASQVPAPGLLPGEHPEMAERYTPVATVLEVLRYCDKPFFDRFYRENDTRELATMLYCTAQLSYVYLLWTLYTWRIRIDRDSPEEWVERGPFTWAYFIFYSLGRDSEAKKVGKLLVAPAVEKDWFSGEADRDDPWHYLAMHFVTGKGIKRLGAWPPLVRLLERENWKQSAIVEKALKIHTPKLAETISNWNLGNWCWPAPLYALARKAGAIDLLPKDNPFLRWPLVEAQVDMNNPMLVPWLNVARELEKLDVSTFSGLREDALVNKAEPLIRERRKGKPHGNLLPCRFCDAVYSVRDALPGETPREEIHCEFCGNRIAGFQSLGKMWKLAADLLLRPEEMKKLR